MSSTRFQYFCRKKKLLHVHSRLTRAVICHPFRTVWVHEVSCVKLWASIKHGIPHLAAATHGRAAPCYTRLWPLWNARALLPHFALTVFTCLAAPSTFPCVTPWLRGVNYHPLQIYAHSMTLNQDTSKGGQVSHSNM